MKTLRIPFTLFCLLAISALSSHAAELATAKVLSVSGTVIKTEGGGGSFKIGGRESPLKAGDILREGDRIHSTEGSKVFLVFSNGSEITLFQNSSLSIVDLEQEPYTSKRVYNELEADPSKSQTLLELDYGQLDGHVKKLSNTSSFNIETPLGTAAIRGTRFSISLLFTGDKLILSVSNFDGLVDILTKSSSKVVTGKKAFGGGNKGGGKGGNKGGGKGGNNGGGAAKSLAQGLINEFASESAGTRTPIPAGGDCNVSASEGNPVLNAIISGLAAVPGLNVSLSANGTLTVEIDLGGSIPSPEITPDPVTDPGIIVVSPAVQN
jgi:hypothetical protein